MEVNRERAREMKEVVEERIYLKALGKKEGENDGSDSRQKRGPCIDSHVAEVMTV